MSSVLVLNTGSWMLVIIGKRHTLSNQLSTAHTVVSIITVFGLLHLTIYTGYFPWKSREFKACQELNLRASGAISTALGLYFLWNYISWIFFGGDYNGAVGMLGSWPQPGFWLLSLPLVGLPLLFYRKPTNLPLKQKTKLNNT